MAVRSRRVPCAARIGNQFSLRDGLSHSDRDRLIVSIECMEVAAVIDDDGIAVALHPPRVCYRACRSGTDWMSIIYSKVNARMIAILSCDRVDTVALRASDIHRLTDGGDHRYRRCGGCGKEREEGEHERDEQVHPAHIENLLSKLGLVTMGELCYVKEKRKD